MIIYGYINNKLKNKVIDDISYNNAVKILKERVLIQKDYLDMVILILKKLIL